MAKLLEVGLLPAVALEEACANLRNQVRSTRTVTLRAHKLVRVSHKLVRVPHKLVRVSHKLVRVPHKLVRVLIN